MSTKYQLVDKKLLEVQMDSNYHIFKKPVKSKNKTIHRWYYYFIDPVTGKKIQKVCRGCKTQAEAYAFVSSLPPVFVEEKTTIAKIAEWMYIPGSSHLERQKKLGKVFTPETLKIKRFALNIIVEEFGHLELQELTIPMVIDFLMNDKKHSGSWKNGFLTVVGELYAEAPFHNLPYIPVPQFPKFRRNSKKKDIFTVDELNALFDEKLWIDYSNRRYSKHPQFDEGHKAIYLLFLCCVKCGLRIGEGIGTRVNQFLFDEKVFVVDGFWRSDQLVRTTFNKCGSDDDKKIRVAPLPDDFAQMMKKYIQDNNLGPDDYVFQRYGKPIRKWLAEEWFRNILPASGINVGDRILTPHSLRYTYITRMRREVAGETVQKIAGHTSLNMTDYYTRAAIPEMVEAVKSANGAANRLFE
ncbi:MAG: tyrosine-type recombinase/integrase [Treponema porcinum]|uniref:tyrosine-type recombinase/integrase n=1 Tax=Treponema porcinum TaxID=261392 RepID=UPI00235363DF|nr:site-specific integrase [Treponema porcinum]MCI6816287.1 tyrosine-type recombinase/integrase [Treponema porcinum]MDY4189034.1 site-specific integrase [Treponema porcinum]